MFNPRTPKTTATAKAGSASSKASQAGLAIADRLLDSEEHATDLAIPAVAEDAAVVLRDALDVLRLAAGLIREAMEQHIYDPANGERPEPSCSFVLGLQRIDQVIQTIGPAKPCDECGELIPDEAPSVINPFHASGCSCHPDNSVDPSARTRYTVLLLLPDYIAQNFGEETYTAHVDAGSAEAAIEAAQDEAFGRIVQSKGIDEGVADDFAALLVAKGHLDNLAGACR